MATTTNLSTLKIHKLTQAQYDREVENGTIDENALYLTPDEEIDLSLYMTKNNPTGTGSFSLGRKAETVVGDYSFAVGENTTASGTSSFAEGWNSESSGYGSHAEGNSKALENYSHAEGTSTASGYSSHAEGSSIAAGFISHSEGYGTKVTDDSTVDPTPTTGNYAGRAGHAEGYGTVSYGMAAHAEGNGTIAKGHNSHAEGYNTTASGECSHAEGNGTKAECNYSHAEGYNTTVSDYGYGAHAEGYGTFATNENAHAEGTSTTASGASSHSEGSNTTASGDYSHAAGYYTTALNNQYVIGHYNTSGTAGGTSGTTGDAFIIGKGSSSAGSNAMRVTYAGKIYACNTLGTSGADYAEFFEWQDSNPNNEDRRGYFVTLDGDKIKIAEPNDYILGIISGMPCVLGNSDEDWRGRYILDDFGAFITEEFEYEEKFQEKVVNEETGEVTFETKTVTKTGTRYKENPDYDPTRPYIQREDRPEWDAVGMIGVLSVRDDGTCKVNGFCKVANGGIATTAESGYRVIKRVSENIVKVVFR